MSSVVISGDSSGAITLSAPAVAGTNTITLPASTGTALVAATALTVPNTTGTVMVSGNMPVFSAYQSSAQSVSSSLTLIQFQTKDFDTATCFNNTGSTVTLNGISVPAYAFAPNVAGYYYITGHIEYGAQTSSGIGTIYKNGAEYKRGTDSGPNLPFMFSYALVYLNGTSDYVQFYASSGATQNLDARAIVTYFQGHMVRAA